MSKKKKHQVVACSVAVATALAFGRHTAHASQDDQGGNHPKKVFVIAMENHNWTQPNPTSNPQQIFMNSAAPFINSLVNGTSGISDQVAYANNYQAAMIGLHPSEPNYVWAESGQAFNSLGTDDDPYHSNCTEDTNIHSDQHLSAFLTLRDKSWKSYQEDVNVSLTTNVALPMASWTTPIFSHSGNFTLPAINPYYYTTQFNYAAKHNPQIFFRDTNGGCPATSSTSYPPLQQLALDLQNNNVADYTWISPNQFNDQHSRLASGYGSLGSTDQGAIAQGDNFLARVVPLIMASDAYRDGAVIALWFIIISKHAHRNVGGLPYSNTIRYSHSSFLRTMQEILDVDPDNGLPFLGDAVNATDLRALFRPGAIK
jgi:hypothetical protein